MSDCPRLHSPHVGSWLICSKEPLTHLPGDRHIHITKLDDRVHSIVWDSERVLQTEGMFNALEWEVVQPDTTASSLRALLDDLG